MYEYVTEPMKIWVGNGQVSNGGRDGINLPLKYHDKGAYLTLGERQANLIYHTVDLSTYEV